MHTVKKWIKGFNASTCKTHLKMCVSRTKAQQSKAQAQIKSMEREVGQFLKNHQEAKARIKTEQLQQIKNLELALDQLLMWCDIVATRIKFLEKEKFCPPDMVGTIHSIIYCQGRIDVKELDDVREQFEFKYGEEWIRIAHENRTSDVNPQLVMLLSVQPPRRWEITQILVEIAEKFRLDWTPNPDEMPPTNPGAPCAAPPSMGMPQEGYSAPMHPPVSPMHPPVSPMNPPVSLVATPVDPVQYPSTHNLGARMEQDETPMSPPSAPSMATNRTEPPLWSSLFGWLHRSPSSGDERAKTDRFLKHAEYVALFFFEPGQMASDKRLLLVQNSVERLKTKNCEIMGVHVGDCTEADFVGLTFATMLVEEPNRTSLWETYREQRVKVGDIVLLNSEGKTVTVKAGRYLTQDPQLAHFPWQRGVPENPPAEVPHSPSPARTPPEMNASPAPAQASADEYDDLLSRFAALKGSG